MNYKLSQTELDDVLKKAENQLLNSNRIKFKKCKDWRRENVPNEPGIYAIFENDDELDRAVKVNHLRRMKVSIAK